MPRAKPNPDPYDLARKKLGFKPEECIVFEDAEAGVEAAINGGMHIVGIGDKKTLGKIY